MKDLFSCTYSKYAFHFGDEKIGMSFSNTFKHTALGDFPDLEECVLYAKKKN